MATLSEYVSLAQNEVDDNSSEASNVITQAAKEVYQEILEQVDGFLEAVSSEDVATVISTASYTPTAFTEIYDVYYKETGDFVKLQRLDLKEYLSKMNDDDGTPSGYFIDGLTIKLAPAPSTVGTMRVKYRARPAELATTSIIPDKYTSVVKDGMIWRYYAYDNNPAANDYLSYYQNGIRRMQQELFNASNIVKPKIFGR